VEGLLGFRQGRLHRGDLIAHPVHVHYVIQGVTKEQMERFGTAGPGLQMARFADGTTPGVEEIEETAATARRLFAAQ
jgi:hypothetical protein